MATQDILGKAAQIRDALRKLDESTGFRTAWTASTQSEVSDFFGVSVDSVSSWAKKGMPGKKNEYRLDRIAQWLRTEGPWQDRTTSGPAADDKARKLKAEADLKEMQAEREAGLLVPVDMVERTLQRVADGLRQIGEDFGRMAIPLSGRDAQKRINDMVESIEWND